MWLVFLCCMWYCSCGHCTVWVLWLVFLCCMWYCGCSRCTGGCCGRHFCAACSIVVVVIAPCGCCGCHPCATWVLWLLSLHHVGVVVAIFVLCRCCGCHLCAMCGVAVVVIAPCVVSWVPSLCHMWFYGRGGWLWKERMATCPSAREVVRVR